MKYMIMMFGDGGEMMDVQDEGWIRDMIAWMQAFDVELQQSGELVEQHGLSFPSQAKTVSLDGGGQVVVSDGPFAEAKESLAGFWIVDVVDEARGVELAGRAAKWAGRVELREVQDTPPEV